MGKIEFESVLSCRRPAGSGLAAQAWRLVDVELRSRVIPAPMCGISDRPYRALCRAMGADLLTTQMFSAEGLIRANKGTLAMIDVEPDDVPVSVQLLGARPESLAGAAQILVERGATVVDLNMGCPARKITGNDCGSALMKSPELVGQIVRAIRAAIRVPFTVKLRAGWSSTDLSAIDLARRCEGEGVDAVALHGRTREQGYRGEADWSLIARMKEALSIPVIGNGDITSPADAVHMLRETGCDAVMIGRGIIGNPWLIRACDEAIASYMRGEIAHESEVPGDDLVYLEDEDSPPIRVPFYMREVTVEERLGLVLLHSRLMARYKGERRGVLEMRKHSRQYVKGMRGCKALHEALMHVESIEGVEEALMLYRERLRSRPSDAQLSPEPGK